MQKKDRLIEEQEA